MGIKTKNINLRTHKPMAEICENRLLTAIVTKTVVSKYIIITEIERLDFVIWTSVPYKYL